MLHCAMLDDMHRPKRDSELIQIVDQALADMAHRAGSWLVCRPGCTQCCVGAFEINALDVLRLNAGMDDLLRSDPDRAARIQQRARDYMSKVAADFPGDLESGVLADDVLGERRFDSFANDEVCPALDPTTGTCDLYAYRPMTCRVFGPPVRNHDRSLGVCELCFHGASNEEILTCEMHPDPSGLEDQVLEELESSGQRGNTIVAFALAK